MSGDSVQPPFRQTMRAEDLIASPHATEMVLLAAALAHGRSHLRGITTDKPARSLASALAELGATVRLDETGGNADILGQGGHWSHGDLELDCGGQPAVTQLLLGACSLGRSRYRLTRATIDDSSTQSLIDAMTDLGRRVHAERTEAGPVVQISGSALAGGRVSVNNLDAAVAVCSLLLVAPCATADLFLQIPPWPSRPSELTVALQIMEHFGIAVIDGGGKAIVPAPQAYHAGECDLRLLQAGQGR